MKEQAIRYLAMDVHQQRSWPVYGTSVDDHDEGDGAVPQIGSRFLRRRIAQVRIRHSLFDEEPQGRGTWSPEPLVDGKPQRIV